MFTFEYSQAGKLRFLAWGYFKLFLLYGTLFFGVLGHRGWRLEDCHSLASQFAWHSKKQTLVTSWIFGLNWINLMKTMTRHVSSNSFVFFSPQLSLTQVSGTHLFFQAPASISHALRKIWRLQQRHREHQALFRVINGLLIVGNRSQQRHCKRVVSQPLLWISHYTFNI